MEISTIILVAAVIILAIAIVWAGIKVVPSGHRHYVRGDFGLSRKFVIFVGNIITL